MERAPRRLHQRTKATPESTAPKTHASFWMRGGKLSSERQGIGHFCSMPGTVSDHSKCERAASRARRAPAPGGVDARILRFLALRAGRAKLSRMRMDPARAAHDNQRR